MLFVGALLGIVGIIITSIYTYKKGKEDQAYQEVQDQRTKSTNEQVGQINQTTLSSNEQVGQISLTTNSSLKKIENLEFQNSQLESQNDSLKRKLDNLRDENLRLYEKLAELSQKFISTITEEATFPKIIYEFDHTLNNLIVYLEVVGDNSLSDVEFENINLTDLNHYTKKGYAVSSNPIVQNQRRKEFLSHKYNAPLLEGGSFPANSKDNKIYEGPSFSWKSNENLIVKLLTKTTTRNNIFEQETHFKLLYGPRFITKFLVYYKITDKNGKVWEEKRFPPPF